MNFVYIVECRDGTFYTGWTTDIEKRIRQHNCGKGAKYTRTRLPVQLKYFEEFNSKEEALKREYFIKHLSRQEKLGLMIREVTCMAIAEVAIIPMGTGSTSVSSYVANCHKVLENETKIKLVLTPMGSVLEGDLDDIFKAVRKMHEVPFENGAMRVSTTIRIDDRRDKTATIEQKLNSVQQKMNI